MFTFCLKWTCGQAAMQVVGTCWHNAIATFLILLAAFIYCFLKWGYRQIIHFSCRIIPQQPSIFGYPHLWKPHLLHHVVPKRLSKHRAQAAFGSTEEAGNLTVK